MSRKRKPAQKSKRVIWRQVARADSFALRIHPPQELEFASAPTGERGRPHSNSKMMNFAGTNTSRVGACQVSNRLSHLDNIFLAPDGGTCAGARPERQGSRPRHGSKAPRGAQQQQREQHGDIHTGKKLKIDAQKNKISCAP